VQKLLVGDDPFYLKVSQIDRVGAKSPVTSFSLARGRYYRLPLLPIMSQWLKADV